MNKWMLLISITLGGCIPIRVIPKYNPDIYLVPPPVQGYQKTNTIGHTDTEQRWRDLQACGVRQYNEGRLDIGGSRPGETTAQVIARRDRINGCMKNKSYVIYSNLECIKNKNRLVCVTS